MNKIAKSICMIAVVALAFTSCKKKETDDTKSFAFRGSVEQFVEVNEDGEFERMYIDEGLNTYFEEGDKFSVYCITEGGSSSGRYTLTNGVMVPDDLMNNAASDFTGNGAYYSFYPGENTIGFIGGATTNMGTFRLDATQTYRGPREVNGVQVAQMPEKAVYMAAKDPEHKALNQTEFYFRNIMGALSLKLYSPEGQAVKSIAVKDEHRNLVGNVHLRVNEVDAIELKGLCENYDESNPTVMAELATVLGPDRLNYSLDGDIRNEVLLDCGDGVALGANAEEATRFLIVLRPLALMNGCEITVKFTDNTTKTFTSTKDLRMIPNKIINIKPINVD